jgi:hypothetical protein
VISNTPAQVTARLRRTAITRLPSLDVTPACRAQRRPVTLRHEISGTCSQAAPNAPLADASMVWTPLIPVSDSGDFLDPSG